MTSCHVDAKDTATSMRRQSFLALFLLLLLESQRISSFTTTSRTERLIANSWKLLSAAATSSSSNDVVNSNNNNNNGDDGVRFVFAPVFLRHLQNTELPADYSRPWTEEKTKAMAGALGAAAVLGVGGELALYNAFHLEKVGLLLGAVGAALVWNAMGGADTEAPLNGGYDAKLIADKPTRLQRILDYLDNNNNNNLEAPNLLRLEEESDESSAATSSLSLLHPQVMDHVLQVHDRDYVELLRTKCESTDRPVRLSPFYARTLVDNYSFEASLAAVSGWMNAVDSVAGGDKVLSFCLTRPPSHHACRAKGMGGCLLNSVAVAAHYALDIQAATRVGILDIDAHHGNGVAHCVQDNPDIVFVSIHEEYTPTNMFNNDADRSDEDPRSPYAEDVGPLGNLCNLNLPARSSWTQYEPLLQTALDKKLGDCDLLLVAAGFDAMTVDWSSSLRLEPDDYQSIGRMIHQRFQHRVVMGLEGGYAYDDLPKALVQLVQPWQQV